MYNWKYIELIDGHFTGVLSTHGSKNKVNVKTLIVFLWCVTIISKENVDSTPITLKQRGHVFFEMFGKT